MVGVVARHVYSHDADHVALLQHAGDEEQGGGFDQVVRRCQAGGAEHQVEPVPQHAAGGRHDPAARRQVQAAVRERHAGQRRGLRGVDQPHQSRVRGEALGEARERGGVIKGQFACGRRQAGRAATRALAPGVDLDDVGAELAELLQHEAVQTFADRGQQDDRGNTDRDAAQGQRTAQFQGREFAHRRRRLEECIAANYTARIRGQAVALRRRYAAQCRAPLIIAPTPPLETPRS